VAPHLADRFPPAPEDNVGLLVHDRGDGTTLAYFPGVAALTPGVRAALEAADVVLFDGTFWAHDEMPALGLGTRRADAMGHLPVGGPDGSLARLHGLPARRRVYTHLNNTNPLLREDAPERAALAAAGWEVARDGMELGP
jgi:pyrroloquinoline quinone biosynthesis protein B